MPQAKRSSSSSRSRTAFKHPPALKRLSSSLDTAHQALAELRKDTSREAGKGAQTLYTDLRKWVSDARRDSGKLTKALQREFDEAQKQLAKATSSARSGSRSSKRKPSSRSTTSRSTTGRATSTSASSKRSTTKRAATSSGTSKRSTAKRSPAKRTTAKRGTTKS